MRKIKRIHRAMYRPIDDLITYSPLPSKSLEQIDPFLFLNHHGPQRYIPENNGLPFGPHPHRGIETVTFILRGDIAHKDSKGNVSVIRSGGIQWMTAGSGLIHTEVSSEEFKENGGDLEILQLWINLPARLKMTEPKYSGLQKDKIPEIQLDKGNVIVNLISGNWNGQEGAFKTLTNVILSTIKFKNQGNLSISVPTNHNIFFYVIRGKLKVNGTQVEKLNLVEFDNDHDMLNINTETNSLLLFGHARPFNESVVARGPFVMNTEKEIEQAYNDFYKGKMGQW